MKPYRAIVLFMDRTYDAKGFDEPGDAMRWCEQKRDKVLFCAFVLNRRGETIYELEPA